MLVDNRCNSLKKCCLILGWNGDMAVKEMLAFEGACSGLRKHVVTELCKSVSHNITLVLILREIMLLGPPNCLIRCTHYNV